MLNAIWKKTGAGLWRPRPGGYPALLLCLIPFAVLGLLTAGFWPGPNLYDIAAGEPGSAVGQSPLIRWHFYAASDSEEDQLLKIAVKEAVIADAGELLAGAETIADCRRLLAAGLPQLYETACRALAAEEACLAQAAQRAPRPKRIAVYYGPGYFSSRQLARGSLPGGVYETVVFVLEKGEGGNWWCLLYPPLSPGQKVVFAPVPQSRITQMAQQKYDRQRTVGQATAQKPGQAAGRLPVQCRLKILELLTQEK